MLNNKNTCKSERTKTKIITIFTPSKVIVTVVFALVLFVTLSFSATTFSMDNNTESNIATIIESSTVTETTLSTEPAETKKHVRKTKKKNSKKLSVEKKASEASELSTNASAKVETTVGEKITKSDVYLLSINSPDSNYSARLRPIYLSEVEKHRTACIIMGEFGNDYTGACMIAQCMRDAMIRYGYKTIDELLSNISYYAYNENPSQMCYEAIEYIFTQGNAAVEHEIIVMNNSYSAWHESQNFVVEHMGVRFFDIW